MKVIIVLDKAFDPFDGGVQMSTFKLSKKFNEMGFESLVYSFNNSGHIEPKYTRLCFSLQDNQHKNKVNIDHFYDFVTKEKPDFIINQVPYELEINTIIRKLKNDLNCITLACLRNTLFTVKLNIDLYINNTLPNPINRFFQNSLGHFIFQKIHKYKHAKFLKNILDIYDRFVMFGEPNNREIKHFIGDYKQDKLAYIPNSIPHVQDELPEKEKRILWLSRLSYSQKQAHFILPIWKKVHEVLPDWQLDIVGDGDAFTDISEQIEKEEIPRVVLHGKQKPDSYYKRSPIYLMTSANEGFPNTIIEAQSFGCVPIIFNSYPMASWVVKDNENGFLIETNNTDSMAQSILTLASDPENMEGMGNNALKNADRFHIDKVGEMWSDLFHQLHESYKTSASL